MSERRVWIGQCLCPKRHCILAAAGEADSEEEARRVVAHQLAVTLAGFVLDKVIDPWCGLCGAKSEEWRIEIGRTPYATKEAAMPELKRMERENNAARTAAAWDNVNRGQVGRA